MLNFTVERLLLRWQRTRVSFYVASLVIRHVGDASQRNGCSDRSLGCPKFLPRVGRWYDRSRKVCGGARRAETASDSTWMGGSPTSHQIGRRLNGRARPSTLNVRKNDDQVGSGRPIAYASFFVVLSRGQLISNLTYRCRGRCPSSDRNIWKKLMNSSTTQDCCSCYRPPRCLKTVAYTCPIASILNTGLLWTVFALNRDTAVPAEGNGDL